MQELKVTDLPACSLYGGESIRLNMLGNKKAEDGSYEAQFNVTTCREQLINGLRKHVSGKKDNFYKGLEKFNPIRTKVVLIQNHRNMPDMAKNEVKILKQREDGLAIVNLFEKYAAWPLTKMYKVVPVSPKPLPKSWLFQASAYAYIGSTKWVRSPYMLSLYLLLLRAGTIPKLADCTNIDDFIKMVQSYKGILDPYSKQASDLGFLRRTLSSLKVLFDGYDYIFGNRSIQDHYSFEKIFSPKQYAELLAGNKLSSLAFYEGIDRLVSGQVLDWQVKIKLTEFKKACAQ